MTGTVAEPATQVEQWLASFEEALASGDSQAASEHFLATSFWRDLVAFTWNIKTVEGPAEIAALVDATADRVQASRFRITEVPEAVDGIDEAWFAFETAVGRGTGHVRLRGDRAWTLLTSLGVYTILLLGFVTTRYGLGAAARLHGGDDAR